MSRNCRIDEYALGARRSCDRPISRTWAPSSMRCTEAGWRIVECSKLVRAESAVQSYLMLLSRAIGGSGARPETMPHSHVVQHVSQMCDYEFSMSSKRADELEDAFVRFVGVYARQNRIERATWIEIGVPGSVLRRAGINC